MAHPVPRDIQTLGDLEKEFHRGHLGHADPLGLDSVALGVSAGTRTPGTSGEKAVRDLEGLEVKQNGFSVDVSEPDRE